MTYQPTKDDFDQDPRPSNTGVPNLERTLSITRFDYYSASFSSDVDTVEALFLRDFGGEFTQTHGVNGYTDSLKHNELTVRVCWGGQNPGVFVLVSGEDSEAVSSWIRSNFPDHKVSRADVCVDFCEAGSFERLSKIIDPIARKGRAKVLFIGDLDISSKDGRTMYYGSFKSNAFVRLYEKGLEQIGKGVEDADPNWVRFEGQFKPKKEMKSMAAKWSKEEFFQMSKWINKAANEVVGLSGSFLPDPSKRRNSDEQTFEFLVKQYGPLIRRMVEKRGWLGFCRYLFISIFSHKEREILEMRGTLKTEKSETVSKEEREILDTRRQARQSKKSQSFEGVENGGKGLDSQD